MASVTGSRLAFFSSTVTADKVNVVLTTDGSDVAGKAVAGMFNIEVFTSTPGALASGFQASAFIQGAQQLTNNAIQAGTVNSTEQLLDGSYTLIDLSGGSSRGEAIQIIGSAGTTDVVVGSSGDTITGSSNPAVSQIIDASGTNADNNPGPFAGPETVTGGAGGTTVLGGKGDVITGGAGAMQVNDATFAGGETVKGGSGNLTVFSIGKNFSITGSTGGTTFINDQYNLPSSTIPAGGGSSIVGGSGTGTLAIAGNIGVNTLIFGQSGDRITVGSASTAVDGSKGSITITGGNGSTDISVAGVDTGFNTAILAGSNDVVTLAGANTYISTSGAASISAANGRTHVDAGGGGTVQGGSGKLEVALASSSSIVGSTGNVQVFNLGKGDTVTGSTAGTTFIDDSYGNGGNSKLTAGSGTGTFTITIGGSAVAISNEIVGAPGDTITGSNTATYLDGILGNQSIVGGSGPTTVQAATGDTVTGNGQMLVFLDSNQASTTINLNAGHGATTLRDNSVPGGTGDAVSVTGFSTATDVIASATSSGATLMATSTKDGSGNVVLHFVDSSTMTLVGVTDVTKITFTS